MTQQFKNIVQFIPLELRDTADRVLDLEEWLEALNDPHAFQDWDLGIPSLEEAA
jgi:hypothetical protein